MAISKIKSLSDKNRMYQLYAANVTEILSSEFRKRVYLPGEGTVYIEVEDYVRFAGTYSAIILTNGSGTILLQAESDTLKSVPITEAGDYIIINQINAGGRIKVWYVRGG